LDGGRAPDIVRIYRDAAGHVQLLITDIKSAFAAKPEHRLQVAIYHVMLDVIVGAHVPCQIATSIMHQIPLLPSVDSIHQNAINACVVAAKTWYGVDTVCLDVVVNPSELRDSVRQMLVYDQHRLLQVTVNQRFSEIPYAICRNCEGCGYMELCLTDTDQRRDIALVPLFDRESRTVFVTQGIHTVAQLPP
jgi:predicted RecB family nuclease